MFTREKQEMKRGPHDARCVRYGHLPQQMTPFIVGREASVRRSRRSAGWRQKDFPFSTAATTLSVDDPKAGRGFTP